MAETTLAVTLLAHTQLARRFKYGTMHGFEPYYDDEGQMIALTAIRTCYSPIKPSEVVLTEGEKYFSSAASDGAGGTDADRLCRHIVSSGHTSTLEHLTFTFAVEGVSRALLAQLTRHRVGFSYSVQSQRYVRLGKKDKSGGFDYVVPEKVWENPEALLYFQQVMDGLQTAYDDLRRLGVVPEDARAVLPNAAATNLTMTANLRALLDFYGKRRSGRGAQYEITRLADALRTAVTSVEPWTDSFFENA